MIFLLLQTYWHTYGTFTNACHSCGMWHVACGSYIRYVHRRLRIDHSGNMGEVCGSCIAWGLPSCLGWCKAQLPKKVQVLEFVKICPRTNARINSRATCVHTSNDARKKSHTESLTIDCVLLAIWPVHGIRPERIELHPTFAFMHKQYSVCWYTQFFAILHITDSPHRPYCVCMPAGQSN